MDFKLNLSLEEIQIVRAGVCYAIAHAKESQRATKNDPLEVYRCKKVEKAYKKLLDKITKTMNAETKKLIDTRTKEGVR